MKLLQIVVYYVVLVVFYVDGFVRFLGGRWGILKEEKGELFNVLVVSVCV